MAKGNIEIYQLRCFVAVAEELNFRRAAERMRMTQPPLSRQIKLLEHSMGLVLLERGKGAVRLTPAGESLFASAGDILQRTEHAVLSAQQAERGEAGSVTLGFVPYAAIEFVPRILKALMATLPEVNFTPIEMMSYEIAEGLVSGQLDIGITRSASPQPEIEGVLVVDEPFVLAVPAGHRLATAESPRIADLDGEKFVAYSRDRGAFLRKIHNAMFVTSGATPQHVVELSQTHAVLSMVSNGIGMALVPRAAQAVKMNSLVYREIEVPPGFRSTLYVNSGPKRRARLHTRVVDIIRETLAEFTSPKS